MQYLSTQVIIEALDNYSACFGVRSGQSHLLDALTAELLAILDKAHAAMPADDLTAALSVLMDVPAADLEGRTSEAIESLLSLGLIEQSNAAE